MNYFKILFENIVNLNSYMINAPIAVYELEGKKLFSTELDEERLPEAEAIAFFEDLKRVAEKIEKTTIFTPNSDQYSSFCYFLSPVFEIGDYSLFLLAGPFQNPEVVEEAERDAWHLPFIHAKAQEKSLLYMDRLVEMIAVLERQTHLKTISQKINEIFYTVYDAGEKHVDQYMARISRLLMQTNELDFFGYARKNENDVYEIDLIEGKNTESLKGKFFHIGEGALGHAVASERDVHWNHIRHTNRAKILNAHGIFPNHLYCYPIKKNDTIGALLFIGTAKEKMVDQELLQLISFLVNYLQERKQTKEGLVQASRTCSLYSSLVDFLEICFYTKDFKNVIYKILDFFQSISEDHPICFTLESKEYFSRGLPSEKVYEQHKEIADAALNTSIKEELIESEEHISKPFTVHGKVYGLLTIDTDGMSIPDFMKDMLNITAEAASLIYKKFLDEQSIATPAYISRLELLHGSMKELNTQKYELTMAAVDMTKKLAHSLKIKEENIGVLLRACKMIPYSHAFLIDNFQGTDELVIVEEYLNYTTAEQKPALRRAESQILLLVFAALRNEDVEKESDHMNPTIASLFFQLYPEYKGKKGEGTNNITSPKKEFESKAIEKIKDIKGVIMSLNLTAREKEILHLVLEGLNNHEVSDYLTISVHTVKNHITNIYRKLNVTDRVQAMAKIYRIKYEEEE
ncbi:response regulator transcription factor [Pseudobacillus wudalianchiensis]|uniref:HTH luxR-type domain-containing protein n=1 Tax=Pseudobacillus wudalianchiensis TaxID=1743143 RepID=A0A1B9ADQ1_9BACI|nr:helix-turn-helix transcriptional regulator [Bacillus wudalianchiensis]OCA81960.1 hypothetical protein A8F95_14690 [Bacillus wudalianchiensis]